MQVTKVMRYQLIYTDDDVLAFKDFMNVIRELQFDMFRIKNRAIQLYWEYSGYESDYKQKFGEYPKAEKFAEISGSNAIRSYVYGDVVKKYYKNNKRNASAALQLIDKKYKADSKDYYAGKKSIASFKKDSPIELHNSNITILQINPNNYKEYQCTLSLVSNPYKKELGIAKGAFSFKIKTDKGSSDAILQRIATGEWKVTSSKLIIKNGKLFLNLGYSFETKDDKNAFVDGRIMGVDLGIVYPAYMSFNDNPKREKIIGGEIENFRRKVESEKRSVMQQTKYCGNGKIGHGRKCRTKSQDKFSGKIANFRDRINHQYSKFIVDFAYSNNCGTIQMEKLDGISKDSVFLKNWSYYDLQNKIKYKAEQKGINVIFINPKFTSQRCSKCGYIDKENRPTQELFLCKKCGFKTNADYNASQNLATMDIDRIIDEEVKNQSANMKQT
jgi:IS605 OrfB family transposase